MDPALKDMAGQDSSDVSLIDFGHPWREPILDGLSLLQKPQDVAPTPSLKSLEEECLQHRAFDPAVRLLEEESRHYVNGSECKPLTGVPDGSSSHDKLLGQPDEFSSTGS